MITPPHIAPAGRAISRRAIASLGLGSAGLVLVLAGCTAGAPVATPTVTVTTTVTPAPEPQRDIPDSALYTDLYSAQVPALCGHQAGTLVQGVQPSVSEGGGGVGLSYAQNGGDSTFRDVTDVGNLPTGERVIATAVTCYSGENSKPQQLVAWKHVGDGKIALLAGIAVATVFQPTSSIVSVVFRDGAFQVGWMGPAEGKPATDQSLYSSADFTFTSDGQVSEANLLSTTDPIPGD